MSLGQPLELAERVAARLGAAGVPVRHGDGWSNNVWLYDDVVIRIAMRSGPSALALERRLGPRLPEAVGYPKIIDSGTIDGHHWMAQVRLPGDNLAAVWGSLDDDQRAYAIRDLWNRLEAVPGADVTGLSLPATPMYAFEPDLIRRQVDIARPLVGDATAERVTEIARIGLDATRRIAFGLAHTDAVLTNVVWTGSAAIPIDFEFGCLAPVDLDADCVSREVIAKADPSATTALAQTLGPTMHRRGAVERLHCYSVLRNLWAIGKWVENDPRLTDADTWEPVQLLIADSDRCGWVDRLLSAVG